jgi:chromosomal replication initiator protein
MTFASVVLDPGAADVVLLVVCKRFDVTLVQLRSTDRTRQFVHARHVAAWLLRQRGLNLSEIGRALGKDHSTISAALKKIEWEMAKDPRVAAALDEIRRAS